MTGQRIDQELVLQDVRKVYGSTPAVDSVSIVVNRGEFLSLLGPSGCGKTTTLRMIAGFIEPTSGTISIRGEDVTHLEPYKRNTAMVFQNYALFPHLSVFDNVAFGLRRRKVPKAEIRDRVLSMLEMVQLSGMEKRLPRALSGGQQQRVALARALVLNAAVVLLDEPLSNLDAKLRASTRFELRRLQQEFGFTTVFVTHDQEEALAISDRIAVMNQGRIEQIGTTREIYQHPATPFVADFIGSSNAFKGTISAVSEGGVCLATTVGTLYGIPASTGAHGLTPGERAQITVRAENITVDLQGIPSPAIDANSVPGEVEVVSYLGAALAVSVRLADDSLIIVHQRDAGVDQLRAGQRVQLRWPTTESIVFSLSE